MTQFVSPEEFAARKAARDSNRKAMKGNSRPARERKRFSSDLGSSGTRPGRGNAGHLPPKAERQTRDRD